MSLERITIPTTEELRFESANLDRVAYPLAFTGRALFVSKFLDEDTENEVFSSIYGTEGYIKIEEFSTKSNKFLGIHVDIIENSGAVIRDYEVPRYLTEVEGTSLIEDIREMLAFLPNDRFKV